MKPKGYYDLLLKNTDDVNEEWLLSDLKHEKDKIKNIDKYLTSQLNHHLFEHLQTLQNIDDKISFMNKILSSFSYHEFGKQILLQIQEQFKTTYHNKIRLTDDYLFTNENEQELINQLNQEIKTADEVKFIYPFISQTMLNKLQTSFNYALKNNISINFITTTFDDMALFVNLHALSNLVKKYPNILIRIENNYEKRSERIHIKAAIFQRKSGFSTAIIGSSNLTHKGMIRGREWNIKINQFNNFELYQTLLVQFQRLWNDRLIDFNNEQSRTELIARIEYNRLFIKNNDKGFLPTNYFLYDFQIAVLNHLKYRRKINKSSHLVVMATGTGKTVVSAFDYLNLIKENNGSFPTILFLAHQKEIIEQALLTFRKVLNQPDFAKLLNTSENNFSVSYLFATIQTVHRHLQNFKPTQFDIIIFDEAHHIAAKTFAKVFNYFKPKQIVGLTATPEREDNQSILSYFNNEVAYELRVWEAINERLLSPFDYYCIDDLTADLVGVDLNNDQEVFQKLNTESRNKLLFDVINNYIGFYEKPICLIFCINTIHAEIVANYLRKKSLSANFLTNKTNSNQRKKIINEFRNKDINYLCVVNMFNEGIDIPEINTIILLRPTNSKTIYLQQLGRGLRKIEGKNKLEVYDLIANIDKKYDITVGIKSLYNSHQAPTNFLNHDNNLPYSCTITLEPRSEETILNNLKKWYETRTRIHALIKQYYELYENDGVVKILASYDLTLAEFYNYTNDFYLKISCSKRFYLKNQNNTNRNKSILKQFLFLNDYEIINYFYLRLQQKLQYSEINHDYDNLLICSLFYEITSITSFKKIIPNYETISDLVTDFINHHQIIVEELILILKYKLNYETLLVNKHKIKNYPLLSYKAIFTVRQVLCAINCINFIKVRSNIKIIVFQAGYLTYDKNKSVILADIDAKNYGKLTKYDEIKKEYFWSIPETKNINSKLVQDLKNNDIEKILFLNNNANQNFKTLSLKLYHFIGIGELLELLEGRYITGKFLIK